MSKKVTSVINQNIVDVCLQEYGSLEFLFDIHSDNGLYEFPARIEAGSTLTVFPERVTGSRRAMMMLQERKPGTGEHAEEHSLFWNGYMHPDNYLYPDSHLFTP